MRKIKLYDCFDYMIYVRLFMSKYRLYIGKFFIFREARYIIARNYNFLIIGYNWNLIGLLGLISESNSTKDLLVIFYYFSSLFVMRNFSLNRVPPFPLS